MGHKNPERKFCSTFVVFSIHQRSLGAPGDDLRSRAFDSKIGERSGAGKKEVEGPHSSFRFFGAISSEFPFIREIFLLGKTIYFPGAQYWPFLFQRKFLGFGT